ncbi:delta-class carbonic anhydrase [Shewanella waksmanii]|uniref:delta-class carbonic anhydrase n=1 Tax=Shewanella waksmanii TaxID=213783 RepID=UPI00048FDE12|nr:delta-class carbonic anhydrase [Shewanella waksmanii]
MKKNIILASSISLLLPLSAFAGSSQQPVADSVIKAQRSALAANTAGQGFGPQSPRNIDNLAGENQRTFAAAPHYSKMNLCNIHFHKNAEHQGGEFTQYAGNGNGKGYHSGYVYAGELSEKELTPISDIIGGEKHSLNPGDTIEVHYVHSSADVTPGPTLGACLSESIANPQLRVETQVFVLVNDTDAANFMTLTELGQRNGYHQALNIPNDTGTAIEYAGSTTGPSFNEQASPLQVSWRVRPQVMKVDIHSVGQWLTGNVFDEDHAHGVRNLVTNPKLLSNAGVN